MITFRHATLPEVTQMLDWAAAEGWNPGLDDAVAFLDADPHGFFVAVDAADEPLASVSVVNHSDDFAFLGLYIVRPEHRGKGVGFDLWQHAMAHAGDRTIGLDGVEAQQDNYAASGFAHAGGTVRFTGMIPGATDPDIRATTAADIPMLIAKEAEMSGVAKPAYLQAWFTQTESRTTLMIGEENAVDGFCTIRACRQGAKIGPLVSESSVVAARLISHAATLIDGPVTLDVPETASGLSALCHVSGLEAGFKTARMYRGLFETPKPSIFAVTSLELG